MIYTVDGNAQNVAWDYQGEGLAQAYSIDGLPLLGDHKPIKNYDYASDPDPDKDITWSYNLNELRRMQGNCFTIGIQTDTHFLSAAGATHYANYGTPEIASGTACITQLKNMSKRLYFDCIANLGDVCHGWDLEPPSETEDENEEALRRMSDYAECPVFVARGNHDVGMYHHRQGAAKTLSEVVPKADLYDEEIGTVKATTTITEGTGEDFYYYKDFDECRVIVLDTNDYPFLEVSDYDIHGNHHTMSAAQLAWFTQTALNTGKPVLVLCHNTLLGDVLPQSNPLTTPAEDKQYNRTATYRGNDAVAALEDFADGGGTVVGIFMGHMHTQDSVKVNGINHIAFADGGYFAEIAFIDFDARTITTKLVGTIQNNQQQAKSWVNRTFTF